MDTNVFSDIATGRSQAARQTMDRVLGHSTIVISTVTEAEILFGLARKPQANRLRGSTEDLLSIVDILSWDSAAAHAYANLRVRMSQTGKALSGNDTLIAAHALATGATLVTRDTAFSQIDLLHSITNWATDL